MLEYVCTCSYGTTHDQLQGYVDVSCTCSRCILHAFWMCPAHILDTFHVWQNRAWQLQKSCCSFISTSCQTRPACISDASGMWSTNASRVCSICVSHVSHMHPVRIPDASCLHMFQTHEYYWAVLYAPYVGCNQVQWILS